MLIYHLEFKESAVLIRLAEKDSRRILYLDTLKALAKPSDQEALAFLVKIHLRSPNARADTLSFQQIELNFAQAEEAMPLLGKTGRLHFQSKPLRCEWDKPLKLYWKGEKGGTLQAVLEEFPLEACAKVCPFWFIKEGVARPFSSSVSWKWIELFAKGPLQLEGAQRKKFLEEEPPVVWKAAPAEKPLEVFPELVLADATGCFADLWMDYRGVGKVAFEDLAPSVQGKGRLREAERHWEKDLLESGFLRKQVGGSHYFCPSDKAKSALVFLLEMGWQVRDFKGRRVLKQSGCSIELKEEKGKIAVRGEVAFQEEKCPLKRAMLGRLWIELGPTAVGLLEKKPCELEGEWEEEVLLVRKEQTAALAPLLGRPEIVWDEAIRRAAEGFKNGAGIEAAPPGDGFQGELLPYQQKGVDWLAFLHRWGFSGLLADEMGLGKTVQVLAFFSRLRTNLPILIAAPTSLLYNWKAEIVRFLGVEPYLHNGPDRKREPLELQNAPLILTSYAVLRLDEALLSQVEFEAVVLDESNAIKTASTQIAQAVCRLKAHFRIALSGTPIENRIEELWSQFRFLMPRLLGEKKAFQAAELELIRKKVRPFILRRKKEEVQIELPEKIDQTVWIEMEEGQKKAYGAFQNQDLLKKVAQEGLQAHRMEVLERILRMRQACADPRLIGEEIEGAKIQRLIEDLEESVEEKRKVLIYSQFTSMLQLIRKELEKRGWDALYLDGSTGAEERGEAVRRFQEEPEPLIFLLSLKAGGVGLNLTAAETVFLFDPWWNDAAERQAIDRAHRIGQKKTVVAKRYLIPNSIEERMLELKSHKQKASDQILESAEEGGGWSDADLLYLLKD